MDNIENQNTVTTPSSPEVFPGGNYARWASNLLDGIYLSLMALPIFAVFELITDGRLSIEKQAMDRLENNLFLQLFLMIGYLGYYIWFNVKRGATPGRSSYGLKIVRHGSGEYMGFGRAFVREILKLLSYIPLYGTIYFIVNMIIILFTKQKRTIYDLIVDTQVVKV